METLFAAKKNEKNYYKSREPPGVLVCPFN